MNIMNRFRTGCFLGVALLALFSTAAACPPGSVAGGGDMLMSPLGPVIVESCVTESGGTMTFTYEITNEARRTVELCLFQLPGLGLHATASTSEPVGMTASISESSACATWWAWKGIRIEMLPGETVTFSVSLTGFATPMTGTASLTFCDGTTGSVGVLVPSACEDLDVGTASECFCEGAGGPCEATGLFVGEGTQIDLFGLDRQVLPACAASWVRHGWTGLTEIEETDRYSFVLEIDGVEVDLIQRVSCVPIVIPDDGPLTSTWHVQYPPDYFEAGRLYEVSGTWLDNGASAGEEEVFSRTVELQVIPCLAPIPVSTTSPLLPDLVVEIADVSCECAWTGKQRMECRIEVTIVVTNVGETTSKESALRVGIAGDATVRAIPGLEVGESHTVSVKTKADVDQSVATGCATPIEAVVDFTNLIEESNEKNNADETCCQ